MIGKDGQFDLGHIFETYLSETYFYEIRAFPGEEIQRAMKAQKKQLGSEMLV